MSLKDAINRRGISEALHFTTNRGVTGALASGYLLSRPLLKKDDYLRHVIQYNASVRPEESEYFDKSENWIRFVNLSISEINKRFFEISRNWHNNLEIWWCILAFDPIILLHDGVRFATTNNGYDQCCRGHGQEGFEALFAGKIRRKSMGQYGHQWTVNRETRPSHLPTCEQAEILYPEKLCLGYLTTIYVEDGDHQDRVVGWLRQFEFNDIDVVVQPKKFVGRKN